jgi:hypothetical protein
MPSLRARLSVSVLAIASLAALVRPASAQAIRAAALPPAFKSGASTPELRDKFQDAVLKGLSSLSGPSGPNGELGEVLGGAETRQRLGEELMSCSGQASCLSRTLAALRVNRLIATELTVVGKSYTISLRLFDGGGRELTHAEDLCEICTVREADEALTKAAQRLAAAARTFPVEAVVGAEKSKPAPPPKPEPPPPTRASPMQEPPAPAPMPTVRKERRHFPWRPVAFASLAVGIVGLAVGIPLVVIDGRPTCDAADPVHQCKEVYNTVGGGGTMLALGAIGLVASVPLFYFDYRDRHRALTALRLFGAPAVGGGTLTLEGRF